MSRNGWISVAAFIGGLIWIYWMQKRAEERTLVGEPTLLSPQAATNSASPLDPR